jgi:outer membrane receptor protein involved in Fe transport
MLAASPAAPTAAQEFRGTISGRVTDTSGAVLPGATVTATNTATNQAATSVANHDGLYNLPFLVPGIYTVVGELQGFKKLERRNIEVRVGDRLAMDVRLELGGVEETITVTSTAPLLDSSSASAGQVIDEQRIALLPLSDGNPFVLSRLVPGVAFTGDLKFSRPFDNGGTSSINADGSSGGNEFSLDGSPNMANGRRVAFVPPAGAVQEFRVSTASFDAGDGHTAGALVNVTLKSGTNSFRGQGYYYTRDESLSATDFFVNKAGDEKPALMYRRFGGSAGLPLKRDRTFLFSAVEWLYDEFPEPGPQTVPTEAMRNGDFSALLAQGIQIYDPATARLEGGFVTRSPFPGNIIPAGRISPVARQVLSYYPPPNQTGDAQGRNNFFSTNPRTDDFYSLSARVDHRLTSKQQLMGRYVRNDRREARNAFFGEVNGVTPVGNFLFRQNDAITIDHVYAATNQMLLNVRGGWSRFREPNIRQHEGVFDPASLGFSPTTVGYFNGAQYMPRFDFDSLTDFGDNIGPSVTHSIYSLQPAVTRTLGSHSLRAGYDARLYREFGSEPGRVAGLYEFRSNYTRQRDNSGALFGQDIASFMLGIPTGGSLDRNAERLNDTWYHGLFLQDDWKLSDRLTVNLGLRYEYEGATVDSANRNVRGFDPSAAVSIEAAARSAYAASPIPEVPPSSFAVRGGLEFASDAAPGFYEADGNNFQPRVGAAYALSSTTVIRAGVGVYTVPNIIFGNYQPGFSSSQAIVPTLDNGLTFRADLTNPYPDGVASPVGAAAGADTFIGRTLERPVPLEFNNAHNMRYIASIQRELPGQWVIEAAYAGSRGWDLTTGGGGQAGEIELNGVPAQYLSTSQVRDQATINFLTAQVTNPFRGLLPGTSFNGATIARSQLLRPFPHLDNVRTRASDGTSRYHSAQFKLERRFIGGYSLLAAYTWSTFTERVFRLNPTDTQYEERLSEFDVPHRLALSGIFEVPYGNGRRWGAGASGFAEAVAGGWSVQAIGQIQSGRPISFHDRNIYFGGALNGLKANYSGDTNQPVFDISGFYFHDAPVQVNGQVSPALQRADQRIRLANNLRYFPSRVPGLRGHGLNLWDISFVKQLRFNDRVRGQFHIELLNAFNRAVYNNPNTDPLNAEFGKVNSQANLPRDIQLAVKVIF